MRDYGIIVASWLGAMLPFYALFAFIGVEWNLVKWMLPARLLFALIGGMLAFACTIRVKDW